MINVSNRNQEGVVAIFSVLIIMGIVTLLTLGFTLITQQSQRRTLDDHLGSQAYYAAESGVNMAISEGISFSTPPVTDCNGLGNSPSDFDHLSPGNNFGIEVTCLLINPTPSSLIYENVPTPSRGQGIVGNLEAVNPANPASYPGSLAIHWDYIDQDAGFGLYPVAPTTFPNLPTQSAWGSNVGIVRVDLLAWNDTAASRSDQVNNSYSFYLYPGSNNTDDNGNSIPNYLDFNAGVRGPGGHGQMFEGHCSASSLPGQDDDYRCHARVSIVPGQIYKIRLTALYQPSRIKVDAMNSSYSEISLKHGQAEIDSTGKAGDVYRRINVRVALNQATSGLHEVFNLFGGSAICKRYTSGTGFLNNGGGPECSYP